MLQEILKSRYCAGLRSFSLSVSFSQGIVASAAAARGGEVLYIETLDTVVPLSTPCRRMHVLALVASLFFCRHVDKCYRTWQVLGLALLSFFFLLEPVSSRG